MKRTRHHALHDFLGLFIPRRCAGCDMPLLRSEECICKRCGDELPRTRFHEDGNNAVEQLFRGKIRLHAASAFLRFSREGVVQRLMHRLKYHGEREVGIELGRFMGQELRYVPRFADVDTALAVPLHARKLQARGFNQAQLLVDGMREVWPMKNLGDELLRSVRTSSQTTRGRVERWLNVKEAFHVPHPEKLRDAHVLLVDDVVTTGATIEACALALSSVPGIRLSVFTCACA